MELLGLSGAALWATLGAAFVCVVGLYLLRLRRRRVVVAYAALWNQVLMERSRSALWSRLTRWASLLLALLIAGLLVFALGNPRQTLDSPGRDVVILIDASASMQATDVFPNRLEQARRAARDAIRRLGPGDRALIAQLDQSANPLCALTDDLHTLELAVNEVHPTDLSADLLAGVRLAGDVLRESSHGEVLVIGDGGAASAERARAWLDRPGAPRLRYVRVGTETRDNVGIIAFAARRYPLDKTRSEVLTTVRNYSDRDIDAELGLFADAVELRRTRLSMKAHAEIQLLVEDVSGADRTLRAELRTQTLQDALPSDDVAYVRLPERTRTRVLVVSDGNRYLEAALLLDEYLRVRQLPPAAAPSDGDALQGFDVVIYDGVLPARPPGIPALYLPGSGTASGGASPLEATGEVTRPFVGEVVRDDPLTRFAALRDLNIARALRLKPQAEDHVAVRAEGGAALLVHGVREGIPFVTLAFDPRDSDLPLRVAWPLLIMNTLEFLAGEASDYQSSQPAGRVAQVAVPAQVARVTVTAPDGAVTRLPTRDAQLTLLPDRAGFYGISGEGVREVLAVRSPTGDEGALAARSMLASVPAETPSALPAPQRRTLWPWLLALALLLLSAEWLTFHRRWTV